MKKMLIFIIFLFLIAGGYYIYSQKNDENESCKNAYNCVIDKNNKDFYHCKYKNSKGKEKDINCSSLFACDGVYECSSSGDNYELVNCKIKYNNIESNITCPNVYCIYAFDCHAKNNNSDLLSCKYQDNFNNITEITCPATK